MRTLRLSLAGTASLILLGSLAGGALAQSDEGPLDPMRAGHFTGAWSETISEVLLEDFVWTGGPGYGESLGNETVAVMDASDPRISGTFTQVLGVRSFPIDPEADIWALAWTATVRIENEDGAWAGTFEGFNNETIPLEWYHLTGEGAYEGLTATMRWTGDRDTYEGIIIPGVPPDYPAPIASVTAATDETMVEEAPAPPDGVTFVTGTEQCGIRTPSAWTDTAWGDFIRDSATTCENTMSDPRVSGSWQNTYNGDCYGVDEEQEFCILRGTHVLDGPDGGWECTWTASDFPVEHTDFLIIGVCPGTGAYEGLTYVFQHTGGSFDDGNSFRGAIYEGPPVLGPESMSAE